MAIREKKEKVFDTLYDYLNWYAEQYHNQTGIKVCGLSEAEGEMMKAEYIELY